MEIDSSWSSDRSNLIERRSFCKEDGPFVFLYQPLYLHAVRNDIQGFLPGSTFALTKLYPVSRKQ